MFVILKCFGRTVLLGVYFRGRSLFTSIIVTTIIFIIRMIATTFSFEFFIIIDNLFFEAFKIIFILFILLVCPSFVSHFLFLLLSEQKFNFDELGMGLKHFGKYFCIWTGWTQHRCALIYLEACLMSKTGPSCPKTFAQPFHSSELLHL